MSSSNKSSKQQASILGKMFTTAHLVEAATVVAVMMGERVLFAGAPLASAFRPFMLVPALSVYASPSSFLMQLFPTMFASYKDESLELLDAVATGYITAVVRQMLAGRSLQASLMPRDQRSIMVGIAAGTSLYIAKKILDEAAKLMPTSSSS